MYNLILCLLAPLFYCHRWITAKQAPVYGSKPSPHDTSPHDTSSHDIWLHAASVGELNLAKILIDELLLLNNGLKIIITVNTATAANLGASLVQEYTEYCAKNASQGARVTLTYAPYDLPFIVNKFLDKYSPRLLVILEAELWRNASIACHRRQLPIILANARLTRKSMASRIKFGFAMPPPHCLPATIAVQSSEDADNFYEWYTTIGAPRPSINVCGNIKFDAALTNQPLTPKPDSVKKFNLLQEHFKQLRGKGAAIWCGASTHHPEEDFLLDAYEHLLQLQQPSFLILAPRHPHRFNQVAAKIAKRGFQEKLKLTRFSELGDIGSTKISDCQILLLDTLGDLPHIYSLTDFAYVGGSFTKRGGQNILEPLACGAAVILGPHHHNLTSIMRFFNNDCISIVQDRQQLINKLSEFATPHQDIGSGRTSHTNSDNSARVQSIAGYAKSIITEHQGAAAAVASLSMKAMKNLV
ncbi:MAG: hypothetical protein K0U41_04260 [Gammaproteobacteria bacterium]|nr:hypothetical protein [Gammaproteobacteria bacterium]